MQPASPPIPPLGDDPTGVAYLSFTTYGRQNCQQLRGAAAYRIGRGNQNLVPLYGELVSRNHAIIEADESGVFYLRDLGSRNGTFLNGRRVSSRSALSDGDRIVVGGHELRFHQPSVRAGFPNETSTAEISAIDISLQSVTSLAAGLPGMLASPARPEAIRILKSHGAVTHFTRDEVIAGLWPNDRNRLDPRNLVRVLDAAVELARFLAPVQICVGVNVGYASTPKPDWATTEVAPEPVDRAIQLQTYSKSIHHDITLSADTFDILCQLCPAEEHFCIRRMPASGANPAARVYAIDFACLEQVLTLARQSLQ